MLWASVAEWSAEQYRCGEWNIASASLAVTAIDRSLKTIEAAARRNAAHVEAGKAEFFVANLEDSIWESAASTRSSPSAWGLFHRDPERAYRFVGRWLAPVERSSPSSTSRARDGRPPPSG